MTELDRLDLEPGLVNGQARVGDFPSILFGGERATLSGGEEPPFFRDLNLDQVVESLLAGRDQYDLRSFFYEPLRDVEAVTYRHEVFRDLELDGVRVAVAAFCTGMERVRRYLTLSEKQRYKYEKERWFLDAAAAYCDAVSQLHSGLVAVDLGSRGFKALRDFLSTYTASERFRSLRSNVTSVLDSLGRVTYALRIKGARVTVSTYQDEPDYSSQVEETFARFSQGAAEDHLIKIPDSGSMDHVEAQIAGLVARLYPPEFRALDEFFERRQNFLDPRVAAFDREVQFYLAYLEFMQPLTSAGLAFCYPAVSSRSKETSAQAAFDIALAEKLVPEGGVVVSNDLVLRGPERVLVVTGPNQGGKTTFARMFGQLHYLASLGVPVPGRRASLFLADRVFTHFEREEDIRTLRGKLDDELVRIREILEQATRDSVVTLNETFSSTTLSDAILLSTEVLKRITDLGCLAVWVTFVDELASLSDATVSMVATVAAEDPSRRTFSIVHKPADGRAYAWALAEKYGLSYDQLRSRVGG